MHLNFEQAIVWRWTCGRACRPGVRACTLQIPRQDGAQASRVRGLAGHSVRRNSQGHTTCKSLVCSGKLCKLRSVLWPIAVALSHMDCENMLHPLAFLSDFRHMRHRLVFCK